MKRQTLRMLLLLLSFAVFPITVIYMAPAPPIMSLKAGVINLSVITVLTIFLSGFIFRRAFCGWLCPGGGCQLVAGELNNQRMQKQKINWFRIILVSVWVIMMIATVIFSEQTPKVDVGHPGAGKFATSHIRYFLPYIPVVVFIFIFVLMFGRRGFCHRGCWLYPLIALSTRLGTFIRTPSLYVAIRNSRECNDCKLCTRNCTMSIDVNNHVQTKVPLPNNCVQCGQCVDTCTRDVLRFAFGIQKVSSV
ncbi:MAG: 4Fe-4S binding protein [Bacteroidales bacterium]|nr:MAG: 4Fe-4S binding protein [Bacteroidales bacterium]